MSEAADRVYELLDRFLDELDLDAEIEVEEDDEEIRARVVGDDLAVVIGHHGQTIDALQHVAYRIAFPGPKDHRRRVVVDAAGYRDRRAAALRSAADQAAEAALQERRPVALDAMSALERKVVHEHLKSRHDVETYSEGQEPARRLVVAPLVEQ